MEKVGGMLILFLLTLLCACSSEEDMAPDNHGDAVYLSLSARRAIHVQVSADTRGAVSRGVQTLSGKDTTYFPEGTHIGVTLDRYNTTQSYDATATTNMDYVSYHEDSLQYWWPAAGLQSQYKLTDLPMRVSAYYPYQSGATDVTKIAFTADSTVDILYSPWTLSIDKDGQGNALPVSHDHNACRLSMYHAQAVIAYELTTIDKFIKPEITHVSISGDNIGTKGLLNSTTGTWSEVSGSVEEDFTPTGPEPVKTGAYYVFPTGEKKAVKFAFSTFGTVKTADTTMVIQPGKIYRFHFTLARPFLILQGVSVEDWDTQRLANTVDPADGHFSETHDWVDMGTYDAQGNHVGWSRYNMGATFISDVGDHYMWGQLKPVEETGKIGPTATYTNKEMTAKTISKNKKYDPAFHDWGTEWHIPTNYEWNQLCNTYYYSWQLTTVTDRWKEPVKGYKVVNKTTGAWIFLPVTGYLTYKITNNDEITQDTTAVNSADSAVMGYYWSGEENVTVTPYRPYYLRMDTKNQRATIEEWADRSGEAFPIRPVRTIR